MKLFFTTFLLAISICFAQAQTDADIVYFSGVVVDGDSLTSLPYTHIIVKSSRTGTVADYYGFFSILAHKGDTILFSRVGYSRNQFVIPDTLTDENYSVIHLMYKETIALDEVKVYPWPSFEEFKESFTSFKEDLHLESAKSNLENEKLMELSGNLAIEGSTIFKREENFRHTMIYETNGYQPYGIFNPFAWQQFIKAWRSGDLKDKKNKNYLPK
ncbi:MAG: carboxypeptidase-like regulatory domain-containing protein [Flavobacteriales bacterium]|nr:carboxypeptidase-like regulatory domain-containing protein [Flavobacteriales bacterium]MCB9364600.1 carboxypeptidase-like regulatory domain-containing protein [Flavobacteriales bacterium]